MAPLPLRRAMGRSSPWTRDMLYWSLFLCLAAYHLYVATTTHSTMALTFQETQPPPPTTTTTTTSTSDPQIPLDILTASSSTHCLSPLIYLPNHVAVESSATISTTDRQRKIPKIIHMTSKSRCFPSNFYDNIQLWQKHKNLEDYSLYLHDDVAVDRLLSSSQSQRRLGHSLFPHLNLARKCLRSGAGLADLWRYVVLWEYGGIYTDIDNAPGKFWTADTIQDDDDAFFVIEHLGVLSQYFFAVSPHHPLMYLCILISLQRILAMDHVGKQNIPVVTGPGALKVAFKYFMKTPPSSLSVQQDDDDKKQQQHPPSSTKYGRVKAGKYYGVGNRSVTVVGTKDTGSKWVIRGSVENKAVGYQAMGMKHFSTMAKKKFNESCLVHLWNMEFDFASFNSTNW